MNYLAIRKRVQARRKFARRRGHWKKLGTRWVKPRGLHSKLRRRCKSRGKIPSIGYSSPAIVRGLNKKGFNEVRVCYPAQLSKLNPKTDVALIASAVGYRKRQLILKKADELKVKVTNR